MRALVFLKKSKDYVRRELRTLIRDESGQTTAEYIFLLVIVVMAVKVLGGNLQGRLKKIMDAAFDTMEAEVSGN